MKRIVAVWAIALLAACDVDAELGSHDAATIDAPSPGCHTRPDGGACGACEASACCDPLAACTEAVTCLCITDCILTGHTLEQCTAHCGGPDHGEHAALLTCVHDHCMAVCP